MINCQGFIRSAPRTAVIVPITERLPFFWRIWTGRETQMRASLMMPDARFLTRNYINSGFVNLAGSREIPGLQRQKPC